MTLKVPFALFESYPVETKIPDIYNNLACAYMQRGKHKRRNVSNGSDIEPNACRSHSNLGNLLKAQGKLEEASVAT